MFQAAFKMMMTFKFNWYVLTKDSEILCRDCQSRSKVVLITAARGRYPDEIDEFMPNDIGVRSDS